VFSSETATAAPQPASRLALDDQDLARRQPGVRAAGEPECQAVERHAGRPLVRGRVHRGHGARGPPTGVGRCLAKTGYMVSSGTQMHQRLGCTVENIMGMKSAGFGSQPSCGVLQGLSLT
jgi:predicted secreted Zn-dependent protease